MIGDTKGTSGTGIDAGGSELEGPAADEPETDGRAADVATADRLVTDGSAGVTITGFLGCVFARVSTVGVEPSFTW